MSALAPLALRADFEAACRPVPDGIDSALEAASDAVRAAAGVPIARTSSTVRVLGGPSRLLSLPGPVVSVDEVIVDGSPVTDYRVWPDGLRRACGWGHDLSEVEVTMTFGYDPVPADIVELVCELASLALAREAAPDPSVQSRSESLDDYRGSVTYETGGGFTSELVPAATRRSLRERFSGGVWVIGEAR